MEKLLILPALLLLATFALCLAASLRLKSRIAFLMAIFLFAYGNVVLTSEIASLAQRITPGFYLLIHLLLASAAVLTWWKSDRPTLIGPFHNHLAVWREAPAFRRHPDLYLLAIGVFLAYLAGALLILFTPQNNYDSMTYHLSRVAYWLQNQSLFPWLTPNPRQASFPPNAEMGLLWTVLFWGTDQLTGFVQWLSVPVCMAAIVGLAIFLGAKRWQAVTLALFWATLPEIFLQSLTTMNDLLAAAFLACAVYLLFLGWKGEQRSALWLSALSIGLAIGVKLTVLMALPGLILAMLLLFILMPEKRWARLFTWGFASTAAIVLLGSLILTQNWQVYKNPFTVSQWTNAITRPHYNRADLLAKNMLLFTSQAFDLSELPAGVQAPLGQVKALVALTIAHALPATDQETALALLHQLKRTLVVPQVIHEDTSWFGLLFPILFYPALVIETVTGIRRRDPLRLGLIFIILGFAIVLSAAQDWTPYRGRYFVLVTPLAAPLLLPWLGSYRGSTVVRWVLTILSLVILYQTLLYNHSKPLAGPGAIWGQDRLSIRLRNNPGLEPVLRAVETFVPTDAVLVTKLSEDAWDYPFFGDNLKRRLIQLDPVTGQLYYNEKIDYILIEPRQMMGLLPPKDLQLVWERDGWSLFRICQEGGCPPTVEQARLFLRLDDPLKLATISPALAGKVGILELAATEWPIEQVDGHGLYWLGESYFQGLKGYLWSDQEREATISVQVEPGPSNPVPLRKLVFTLNWLAGYQTDPDGFHTETVSFSTPQTLEFRVKLQRGLNQFHLYSNDIATISELDNGDRRPLLIKVKDILISP